MQKCNSHGRFKASEGIKKISHFDYWDNSEQTEGILNNLVDSHNDLVKRVEKLESEKNMNNIYWSYSLHDDMNKNYRGSYTLPVKKEEPTPKSKCCNAEVFVEKEEEEATCFYSCSSCGRACDIKEEPKEDKHKLSYMEGLRDGDINGELAMKRKIIKEIKEWKFNKIYPPELNDLFERIKKM